VATLNALKVSVATDSPGASAFVRSAPRKQAGVPSLLHALLPGPLASALRLYQRAWPPPRERKRARRRADELRGRALKALDLLQHAAALGHTDALYLLGEVALRPPAPDVAPDAPAAFAAFSEHAARTGNASSQHILAFFHATGWRGAAPRDPAKAQLYYTFAAHGGDRGAQLALGYRYWAGIGTQRDCARAMEWYAAAAEQCRCSLRLNIRAVLNPHQPWRTSSRARRAAARSR
jgi:SEL1 protein